MTHTDVDDASDTGRPARRPPDRYVPRWAVRWAAGVCQYRAVPSAGFEISTDRLTLRPWRSSDAVDFAEMNADVDVMADLGGPLTRRESDRKLRRFQRFFRHERITRWADPEARVELKGEQRLVTGRAAVGDEREQQPDARHHEQ